MINVTKTYLPNVDKYKEYVDKIFQTGWITNNGEMVKLLEQRLKKFLRVNNLVLVCNGTLALQVAYKLLQLKGEVITTPFSFVATTSSLIWEGLKPVFVDIDEESFCIDTNKIEEKITDKTSAIVPVHVFGNACEVEQIKKISQKYNIKVIYDAAHAFAIDYKGNSILNYGDISVLSFHATKVFHTIEGGALIINDDNLYEKAKKMINFGISGPDLIEGIGINAKMNEFQAAMGLCILDDIQHILERRKIVYERYKNEFNNLKKIKIQKINPNCNQNYGYFPIVFEDEKMLLKVKKVLEENNIYARRYFYPSLNTIDYVDYEYMKNSESISKRILCLPISHELSEYEQFKIINCIKSAINF